MHKFDKDSICRFIAGGLLVASLSALPVAPSWAGTISAAALSKAGEPMPDVVVYATPSGAKPPPADRVAAETIAQDHLQFMPYVTVVRVGAEIKFPNYDKVDHHVKSFSPAKEFEIKPSESATAAPILFDKPGIVVTYCLIHEWMRAYVMVVDTPYFGKSDASGVVTLDGLPAGSYEIRAWHPDMGSIKPALLQTVTVGAQGTQTVKFDFDFVPRKRKPAKTS